MDPGEYIYIDKSIHAVCYLGLISSSDKIWHMTEKEMYNCKILYSGNGFFG